MWVDWSLRRDFDAAIVALAKVRAQGIDAELTIIGQGRERKSLKTIAADHGIADHVHWEGVLQHCSTLEAIAGSSLVLVPSRSSEGFSLVTVEAAFLGVPSVASRVGGLPEVVEDGETGVLVAPGDSDDLARAIGDLWRNPERLQRMGKYARQRALEKFDIERCADDYAKLYQDLTRPNRHLRGNALALRHLMALAQRLIYTKHPRAHLKAGPPLRCDTEENCERRIFRVRPERSLGTDTCVIP